MSHNKLNPFLIAAFAALTLALTLIPARSAAAWDEVCVHLPLWHSAYVAHVVVAHDYDFRHSMPRRFPEKPPQSLLANDQWKTVWDEYHNAPGHTVTRRSGDAGKTIHSGKFGVNSHRCVRVRHIRQGHGFAVYVVSAGASAVAHCATDGNTRERYYKQQNRPHRKLWFRATGTDWHPRCHYWRQTN